MAKTQTAANLSIPGSLNQRTVSHRPAPPDPPTLGATRATGERTFLLDIVLTQAQVLAHYRGQVHNVIAHDHHGRTVSLPISALRPFVTHSGLRGTFAVTVDAASRLVRIEPRG